MDTKAARSLGVVQRAKRPISGVVHLCDRFDAFAPGERKHFDRGGGWHWVSIERNYVKGVPRQVEVNLVRGPVMNKVKPYALAGSHSDCIPGMEHPVTDRKEDFLFVVDGRECCGAHRGGSSRACG
jgi:hypothetical protein